MAKKKSKIAGGRPGPGWFSKSEMASILDVSEVYYDRDIRKLAPKIAVQQIDRRLWFHARPILDAWAREKFGKPDPDDDGAMSGPETESLEILRKHKARIAKVDADKKEGLCIFRDEVAGAFGKFGTRLQQLGEQLKDQFGNEAVDLFNEAIGEGMAQAIKAIESSFDGSDHEKSRGGDAGVTPGTGGQGDGETPADVSAVRGAGAGPADRAKEASKVSG